MVGALLSSKASAVKRMSREDLPTPESPTRRTCMQDANVKARRKASVLSQGIVRKQSGPTSVLHLSSGKAGERCETGQLEGSWAHTLSRWSKGSFMRSGGSDQPVRGVFRILSITFAAYTSHSLYVCKYSKLVASFLDEISGCSSTSL